MESRTAVASLAALAQNARLAIFRLLVQNGPEGLCVGDIAAKFDMAPATLSFHLKELTHAGLLVARQEGRFIYYAANYAEMSELIAFLTEKCCQGMPATQVARIGQAVAACCLPAETPKRSAA